MLQARTRNYCEIAERLVPHTFRTRTWRRAFGLLGNLLACLTVVSAMPAASRASANATTRRTPSFSIRAAAKGAAAMCRCW